MLNWQTRHSKFEDHLYICNISGIVIIGIHFSVFFIIVIMGNFPIAF